MPLLLLLCSLFPEAAFFASPLRFHPARKSLLQRPSAMIFMRRVFIVRTIADSSRAWEDSRKAQPNGAVSDNGRSFCRAWYILDGMRCSRTGAAARALIRVIEEIVENREALAQVADGSRGATAAECCGMIELKCSPCGRQAEAGRACAPQSDVLEADQSRRQEIPTVADSRALLWPTTGKRNLCRPSDLQCVLNCSRTSTRG